MGAMVRTASFTAVMVVASSAAAQGATGSAHNDGFHMGLGAGIGLVSPIIFDDDVAFMGPAGGSVLLPMDIAGAVRLEPEIGFFHWATDEEDGGSRSTSLVRPGLGVFGIIGLGQDAMVTLGGRLGPQFVSSSSVTTIPGVPPEPDQEITISRSRVDFWLSPAVGGEYFFNQHFSLGAETQINFVFVGDDTVERDPDPGGSSTDPDDTAFYVMSNTLVVARVFFF